MRNITINCELVVLNGMFKPAEEKGYIQRNPVPMVKRLPVQLKKIEYFTKKELNTILEKPRRNIANYTSHFSFFLIHVMSWTTFDRVNYV